MLIVFLILIVSWIAIRIFRQRLSQTLTDAPKLSAKTAFVEPFPKVSIVIPAYNEADNIEACVLSVLDSTPIESDALDVWIVDDQSSDETQTIARLIQASRQDPRLKVLAGEPRPETETWMGKNWACAQAVEHTSGEFLLFIDADVRLKSGCVEAAVAQAQQQQIDLLSIVPAIVCQHWSEWLVQPIVISLLSVGFNFAAVNDPKSETAFAAGPFMLFRRSAYNQVGGHRAVRNYVVEDVQLAVRVKQQRLKLWYGLGAGLIEVRMYRSFSALWEGWTKNWYLGSNRNLQAALYCVVATLMIFTVPWIGFLIGLVYLAIVPFNVWSLGVVGLSAIEIFQQYQFRQDSEALTTLPTRYWWTMGIGGLLVSAIVLASIVKTETGWGWTWRGRSLAKD